MPAFADSMRTCLGDPRIGIPLTAIGVVLAIMAPPRVPIGLDPDSSWRAVLGYAWRERWRFGENISFTYGPLGFLWTPYFASDTAVLCLIHQIVVSLMAACGVCLLAWKMAPFWRWLLLATFVWLTSAVNSGGDYHLGYDLLCYVAILCWSLLCLDGKPSLGKLGALTLFAAWSALGKLTFLYVASAAVLCVTLSLFLRREHKFATGVFAVFGGTFVLLWLLAGQTFSGLSTLLKHGSLLTRGYSDAMASGGSPTLRFWALSVWILGFLAWTIAGLSEMRPSLREWLRHRFVSWTWLGFMLFAVWKHGTVRADLVHIAVLLGFMPIFGLSLQIFARPGWSRVSGLLIAITCLALGAFVLQWLILPGSFSDFILRPVRQAAANLHLVSNPGSYTASGLDAEATQREAATLPQARAIVGVSRLDVFGQYQSYAALNDFNYRPRPVFQSYAAYNRSLMELNERFYLSSAAPDYVLFRLLPVDRRFPPLEDAYVFRHVLMNYQLVAVEEAFLVLKRRSSFPASLNFIHEEKTRLGECVDLTKFGEMPLWVEVFVEPNIRGWISKALGKAPRMRLTVWPDPSRAHPFRFNAPPPMLSAGFILSPLLLDNSSVCDFYTGKPVTRPVGLTIETTPESATLWKSDIRVRVFEVNGLMISRDDFNPEN